MSTGIRHVILFFVLAGALVAGAFGGAVSYNLFVSPEERLGGHRFDDVLWFGPSIVSMGILLLWGLRLLTTAPPSSVSKRLGRRLEIAGGALALLVPLAGAVHDFMLTKDEGAYTFLFSFFLFTGPGICLFIFGGILEWSSRRSHAAA